MIQRILAIALNTFREAIRNYILYSVISFALLLVGISAFFGAVSIGDQLKVIKDFGLFSLSFFGALLTMISGVSLLNKELRQKTAYNILSKPVERWEFIVGKYFGLVGTSCILAACMGIALIGFLVPFEGRIDWLLFQGIYFVLLEICIVGAVTVFFSSLVVTTTLTGLFTFGTYIAGRSIGYLNYFLDESHTSNTALRWTISLLDRVLPDLSVFNLNDLLVYGVPASPAHALAALGYCAAYSAVALTLAAAIFRLRELN